MSLETLQRQQKERYQRKEAACANDDSDDTGVAISLHEPDKYQSLNEYEVVGKLSNIINIHRITTVMN